MQPRQNSLIGAVVLAGGKSSRMGQPKQLLPFNGKPLLEHTLANLRNIRLNEILVVLGCSADEVQKQVDLHDIKVVENKNYEQGMGTSLSAGVSALAEATEGVLIVLADQPFVRPETYEQLIDHYRHSDAEIIIPTYRGFRGNPVLLDRSVFFEAMALTGDIGCRAVFGDHIGGIVKVPVEDIGVLLDIDNKADYARLQEYGRLRDENEKLLRAVDVQGRTVPEAGGSSDAQRSLIIVGTEPVAIAIVRLAKTLHFHVTVVDPLLAASDLPDADEVLNSLEFSSLPADTDRYVVIASRGRFDEEAIEQALAAEIGYVGLVANRKRAEEVRRRLQASGHSFEKLAVLRAPAGVDIGANTSEEIALSILAEIVSLQRKSRENGTAPKS
jgi:molybdenum cofactor cytidylyltransferase